MRNSTNYYCFKLLILEVIRPKKYFPYYNFLRTLIHFNIMLLFEIIQVNLLHL